MKDDKGIKAAFSLIGAIALIIILSTIFLGVARRYGWTEPKLDLNLDPPETVRPIR
ncbi:hypothetical protein phiCbK_281 [Caulobacter phage phiCbK]|uniref:Uncharacterized protein n=4 Tax=Viruses TaxID=10239 RepID=J3SL18_9CAUD|nr:hypothetical protein phiCbK_281 [Caulobacter phage phiCbK]ARB14957.1 hypothetical protein Ccr32_gp038 [Caulobacter phage Ccr32]ARB15288.1 hypothetical protein Ccr34_gp039 [Caulobacter phage Ccr34]